MSEQKKSTTPKATVALVNLGYATIEGLYCKEKDQFYVAVTQVCSLFSFLNKNASREVKALLGAESPFLKMRTTLNSKAVNVLQLKDFEKVMVELTIKGNKFATELTRAMVGLSLNQLFCNAFGIKCEEEKQMAWLKSRVEGKEVRLSLTEAIALWYQLNPYGSSRPLSVMIAVTTNAVYMALWEMKAKDLEKLIGCGRNQSRNYLAKSSLKHLELAESLVMDYILEDNIKPIDAVELAGLRKRVLKLKEN